MKSPTPTAKSHGLWSKIAVTSLLALATGTSLLAQKDYPGASWREITKSPGGNESKIQFEINGKKSWEPWKTPKATHGDGTYTYNSGAKTETFVLKERTNRIEYRGVSYTSGMSQFQGEIRIDKTFDQKLAVIQVFHSILIKFQPSTDGGPAGGEYRLMAASDARDLKKPGAFDSVRLAGNVLGKWVKFNVIHDADANKLVVYVNDGSGEKKFGPMTCFDSARWTSDKDFYLKYGAYDAGGAKDKVIMWRNARVWQSN
jgi:hypothetical protein